MGATASGPSRGGPPASSPVPSPPDPDAGADGGADTDPDLDCEAYHRPEWPALSLLLSLDPEARALPSAPGDAFWPSVFREHLLALDAGAHPLRALAAEAGASVHFAGRIAAAFRAALHVLRVTANPQSLAPAALLFAAELVRALRTASGRQRAETLGALDAAALRPAERADIGAAALWQFAAAALDRLCIPRLPAPERAAACAAVFAFVADPPADAAAHALPRIVERYANPPLVVLSLLRTALRAAESAADVELLLAMDPERAPQQAPARPAAAAALAGAVAAFAATFTPRAIAALTIGSRTGNAHAAAGTAESPANGVRASAASDHVDDVRAEVRAASDALCLLLALVACGGADGAYRAALLGLRDAPAPSSPAEPAQMPTSASFQDVYRVLAFWAVHPAGALLAETLLCGNRKFRAYALARTDPDALLLPLLRALHERCGPPSPPADAYAPAAALLALSSDPGFCEAVDKVGVPTLDCAWADPRGRIGASSASVPLSALVLFVCARAVQQSLLLKRAAPETYTAGLVLAAMANVAAAATALHAPAADRLVSLLEFLGRRARRAAAELDPATAATPNGQAAAQAEPAKERGGVALMAGREHSGTDLCVTLAQFTGMALEIIAGVLSSRGDVSANRHLVYALLHREHLVRHDAPIARLSPQCAALCARLERVVRYFGAQVDRVQPDLSLAPGDGGAVLSVERVFDVIDETARLLPREFLAGLPQLRFEYQPVQEEREVFFAPCVWNIVRRFAPHAARPEQKPPPEVADALAGS